MAIVIHFIDKIGRGEVGLHLHNFECNV